MTTSNENEHCTVTVNRTYENEHCTVNRTYNENEHSTVNRTYNEDEHCSVNRTCSERLHDDTLLGSFGLAPLLQQVRAV